MCPRDHTPPLIQSLVSYAVRPRFTSSGSLVKQLHRAELPLCDASRFQLTQLGSPWLALYESVYWRRAMMISSFGFASVGTPSSVLWPTRTFAPPIGASYVVIVV